MDWTNNTEEEEWKDWMCQDKHLVYTDYKCQCGRQFTVKGKEAVGVRCLRCGSPNTKCLGTTVNI